MPTIDMYENLRRIFKLSELYRIENGLPTEFVKEAGFIPNQMEVIFGNNEIKIVKEIKSVET